MMLSRSHCPHTGVVNFFARTEPLLAVGSVIKAREPGLYHWRYYLDPQGAVGTAPDLRTAEDHLLSSHRAYLATPDLCGEARRVAPARCPV
jgi:hypothetical protein